MAIEGYLTTKQIAEKLGVTVGRVQQLVADKRLIAIKVGQTNLIKESDFQKYEKKDRGRPRKTKDSK